MQYLSILYKAVAPELLSHPVLFHGTSKETAIPLIFAEGLKGAEIQSKGKMAPVKGGVYLSPSFEYAAIYAIGGVFFGSKTPPQNSKENPFGYVFTVAKKDLTDVSPDEDSVGELLFKLLQKPRPDLGEINNWFVSLAGRVLTDKQFKDVKKGLYSAWAQSGKKLLKNMSEKQKELILNSGGHLFNSGNTPVIGAYVLRRDHTEVLTGDLDKDSKYMQYITSYAELDAAKERLNKMFPVDLQKLNVVK